MRAIVSHASVLAILACITLGLASRGQSARTESAKLRSRPAELLELRWHELSQLRGQPSLELSGMRGWVVDETLAGVNLSADPAFLSEPTVSNEAPIAWSEGRMFSDLDDLQTVSVILDHPWLSHTEPRWLDQDAVRISHLLAESSER